MTATEPLIDVNGKTHDLSANDPNAHGIEGGDVVRLNDGRVVEVYGVRSRKKANGCTAVVVLYYQNPVTTGPRKAAYFGPKPGDVDKVLIRKPRYL